MQQETPQQTKQTIQRYSKSTIQQVPISPISRKPPSYTPTSFIPIFRTNSSLLLLNFPILSTLSLSATLKLCALDTVEGFIRQASLAALTANDELTSFTSVSGGVECRFEAT